MKHNRILFFFGISLVLSIALRTVQIYFSIDPATGFFKKEYSPEAQYILVVIFLFALALFFFSLKSHRSPAAPPKRYLSLAVVSVLAAFGILYDLFASALKFSAPSWQVFFLTASAVFCVAFFVLLAASQLFNVKTPLYLAIFPTIYLVFKILFEFLSISSLALVSDNMFTLFSTAATMLFMLTLTKLYTFTTKENSFRLLLGWGLVSSLLSIVQPVSYFLVLIFSGQSFSHTSTPALFNTFTLGLFTMTFILTHFSRENTDR
jgi:hypothetical protein